MYKDYHLQCYKRVAVFRYSGDPNTGLVQYSDHGDLSDRRMVRYLDHHLNNGQIVRYSDAI